MNTRKFQFPVTYGPYHRLQIQSSNNETFRFNEYTDMNEEEFAEYMANCHERQLYDTGVTAEYGDELITLFTCEYTYENGRFIVAAKKIVE